MDRDALRSTAFTVANSKMGGSAYIARLDAVKSAVDACMFMVDQVTNEYESQIQSAHDSAASQVTLNSTQTQQLVQAAEQDRHEAAIRLTDLKLYVADVMKHSYASANGNRIEVDRDAWSRLIEHIGEK